MVSPKHAFWQALLFSAVIFAAGLMVGMYFEHSRSQSLEGVLLHSEINLLDQQLRNRVTSDLNVSCDLAISNLFDFANEVYGEAVQLERDDATSTFTDEFRLLHQRYDLLRMMIWSESIALKKRCGPRFHTVVYFFQYENDTINVRAEQTAFSRMLKDLKDAHGSSILLLPIATDMQLHSVDLALTSYAISSAPAVVIDENIVVSELKPVEEMDRIIFSQNMSVRR